MNTALVKAHADLSASSAHRWMPCPGSVRLSRGQPKTSSIYAIEGTIAHQVAEKCLNRNLDPDMYVGLELEDPETHTKLEVTEEMADHVRLFVDYCVSLADGGPYGVETKFSLAKLNPPDDMFGTSDFWALSMKEPGLLEIVDLKYGQGVPIEVEGNPQELYYALGAVLEIQERFRLPIDRVRITIVQPRLAHAKGPIRSWDTYIEALLVFADELLGSARAALQPDAPFVTGEHCRFCPAASICPKLAEASFALAQMDFSDTLDLPPAPESLSVERLAQVLTAAPMIEAFLNACRARGLNLAEQGEMVPGFKAVAKRAIRKWTPTAYEQLKERGLTDAQLLEPAPVKSVAQLEKTIGKKKFFDTASDLVTKISSGYSLVPIADVRPALQLGAQQDFEVLPNNAGQEETQ